jgi:SAM-dependent methyltransferase
MEASTKQSRSYSPALGLDWLLPFYDPLLRAVIPEDAIKRELVRLAAIEKGQRVLDLGCGTATLTLVLKEIHPDAEVIGLDADAKAIDRARQKAADAHLQMRFDLGLATALPYESGSLDRVLSAFVFHHLTHEQKRQTLAEALRVLKPGGVFALLDFGKPPTRLGSLLAPLLHPGRNARDNIRGRLPELMREAGFEDVHEAARRTLVVGSVSHWISRKG